MGRLLTSHSLSCKLKVEEALPLLSQFPPGKLCKSTIPSALCLQSYLTPCTRHWHVLSHVPGFPVHSCVVALVGHEDLLGWTGMEKAQKVNSQRLDL